MNRSLICLCVSVFLCLPARAAETPPEVSAKAALLLHGETGTVLYETNADEFLPIASTTKIMTALVVLERCGLGDEVEILPEDTTVEGTRMGIEAGERYTVEELLYGLLLQSGNDAALALARHCAGSAEAFAARMNERAAALGLRQTHFENPHGLDAEGHGSTARELGLLTAEAMKNETFRRIVSTERAAVGGKTYVNHNRLLRTYPGAIGVKTGYTMAAGRILVSCARREDTELICVTISDPDDWADHEALLDWGFQSYEYRVASGAAYPLPIASGTVRACVLLPQTPPALLLERGTETALRAEVPRFAFAPVRQGQALGRLTLTAADGQRVTVPLCAASTVTADTRAPLTHWERFCRFWRLAGRAIFSFHPVS